MANTTLTGRIVKDPVIRTVGNTKVAKFTVADNYKKKGEQKTNWFSVEVWGDKVCEQVIEPYFTKGREVYIAGEQFHEEWEGNEGTRMSVVIKATTFKLLSGKAKDEEPAKDEEEDDDVPF